MKRLKLVSGILFLIMLISSACAPGAAPTAAPSKTEAAAVKTSEPAPAKTEVQPAASSDDPALTSEYSKAILKDMEVNVDTSKYKKDGPYTIAVAGRDPSNGFGNTFYISAKTYGDELFKQGVLKEPLLMTSTFDPNQEISDIENYIEQKPDALVVAPLGRAALVAVVKKAVDAGIPVVLCTDGIEGEDFTTRVDINLYEAGYRSGEGLAKLLNGKGKIVMFNGIAGVDATETERAAALDALKKYPEIEVVAEDYAQWNIATAKQKMEAMMAAHPQIDGVWAGGGEMALGAALALIDAKKDFPAFAMVNVPNGFLRIADQYKLKFVGAPDPPGMSKYCVQTAVDILQGKPVKKFIQLNTLMKGAEPYDNTDFLQWYVPELNDDFIPPGTVSTQAYSDGGFARK
jgi:ribose transport system substrate-binding protein